MLEVFARVSFVLSLEMKFRVVHVYGHHPVITFKYDVNNWSFVQGHGRKYMKELGSMYA